MRRWKAEQVTTLVVLGSVLAAAAVVTAAVVIGSLIGFVIIPAGQRSGAPVVPDVWCTRT